MAVSCFNPDIQRLMKRLGVPQHAKEFTLRVATDEAVTVEVTFFPDIDAPCCDEAGPELVTKQYKLVEDEDGIAGASQQDVIHDEVGNSSVNQP